MAKRPLKLTVRSLDQIVAPVFALNHLRDSPPLLDRAVFEMAPTTG